MKTLIDSVRIRRRENRDVRHNPMPRTAGAHGGNGPGNRTKLSPSAGSGGSPNPGPKLPSFIHVPDEWTIIVDDGHDKYMLRVVNLTSKPLPLPPPRFVGAIKQAWMRSELSGFADRWALREKNRYLATSAFVAVVRHHLPRPRSMLDIVVDKVAT